MFMPRYISDRRCRCTCFPKCVNAGLNVSNEFLVVRDATWHVLAARWIRAFWRRRTIRELRSGRTGHGQALRVSRTILLVCCAISTTSGLADDQPRASVSLTSHLANQCVGRGGMAPANPLRDVSPPNLAAPSGTPPFYCPGVAGLASQTVPQ